MRFYLLAGMMAIFCLGCGGAGYDGPKLFPVTRKLTKGGAPLPGINISLVPTAPESKAPPLLAVTQDDGSFTIRTSSGFAGAPVGTYKVLILAPPPEIDYRTQKGPPKKSKVIPEKYGTAGTTDKTIDVKEGPNTLTLDL